MIIEKTAPIFNVKGYAGTSLADMTDATGLTKGSIYGNFQNKDEVALAAFDHNVAQVFATIEKEMLAHTGPREKLMVYATVYRDTRHYAFPGGGCPIQNTAIEADDTHVALRQRAAGALHKWKERVEGLVEQGRAEGVFRQSTDAGRAALTIIAMIEGAIMIGNVTGDAAYRGSIMQSVAAYIDSL